jgi:hypothetical protein
MGLCTSAMLLNMLHFALDVMDKDPANRHHALSAGTVIPQATTTNQFYPAFASTIPIDGRGGALTTGDNLMRFWQSVALGAGPTRIVLFVGRWGIEIGITAKAADQRSMKTRAGWRSSWRQGRPRRPSDSRGRAQQRAEASALLAGSSSRHPRTSAVQLLAASLAAAITR